MGRQRKALAALALGVTGVIGVGLWLVMQDPGAEPPPEDEPRAATVEAAPPVEEAATSRKRAGREGSAAVLGTVVRGKDREAAGGLTVSLTRDGTPGWTTTTSASGAFRFDALPAGGPYELSVTVDEYAPVRVPGIALDRREERNVGELRLDVSVAATVTVTDLRGAPIAGARVDAFVTQEASWGYDWSKRMAQVGVAPVSVAHQTTQADGTARFPAVAVGKYTFRATAEGFASGGARGRRLEPQEEDHELTIHLAAGHSISGRITFDDGKPAGGSLVMGMNTRGAWSLDNAPLHARTTADADGRYTLDALDVGDTTVWVGLPGGAPSQVAFIEVPQVGELDIVLRLGGKLHGTVTYAENGEPVVGVHVRASGWVQGASRTAEAVTDAEGKYVLDTLLECTVNQISVEKEGYVRKLEPGQNPWLQLALTAGETVRHDIVLRKAAVLEGTVSGPDGPLPGARIVLRLVRPNQGWDSHNTVADEAGRYRFDGLQGGKGLLQVTAAGHVQPGYPENYWEALNSGDLPEEWSATVAEDGTSTKDIELVLGGVVSGRVETHAGEPIAGASVRASGAGSSTKSVETGEDGTYRLEGVPLDVEVSLTAGKDGYVPKSETTRASAGSETEGVVIRLHDAAVVRGTLSSASGGALDDVFVQVRSYAAPDTNQPWNWQDPDRMWNWLGRHPVTADGTYEIPMQQPDGQFVVRAVAAGMAPHESEPVDVVDGQAEYVVDLALGVGTSVSGRVLDSATGEPVAGAYVKVGRAHPAAESRPWYEQNVQRPIVAITGEDGTFEATRLDEAKYKVQAEMPGYVAASKTVEVPKSTEVELKLKPALEIAGVVRYPDGTPVVGANVQAQPMAPSSPYYVNNQSVATSESGSFRIRDLAAGKYRVTVQAPWNASVNVKAVTQDDVPAGTLDMEVTAEVGKVITGRLVDPAGKGVPGVHVNAQPENPPQDGRPIMWRGTQSGVDGAFRIVGLDDDTFTLNVSAHAGYQEVKRPGISPGGGEVVIQMTAGLSISGVLVDAQGDPRGGENLNARRLLDEGEPQTMQSWHSATVQSDGTFEFTGLPAGEYVIERQRWRPDGQQVEDRDLVLEGGGRVRAGTANLRLELSTGASISGIVVDGAGSPVNGVGVNALIGGQTKRGKATGADGRFEITGLAEDAEYELVAQGGKYRASRVGPFAAGASEVRIVVEEGVAITGRVLDANGDPLPKQNLSFKTEDGSSSAWVTADEDGAFVAEGLDVAVYTVRAFVRNKDEEGNVLPHGRFVDLVDVEAPSSGVELRLPAEE